MKFYFETENSEICYPLDHFKDMGHKEMELFEAVPERIKGVGWCKEYQSIVGVEVGDCGKHCKEYKPKNGKNGCCIHRSSRLFEHGKKVTIKF